MEFFVKEDFKTDQIYTLRSKFSHIKAELIGLLPSTGQSVHAWGLHNEVRTFTEMMIPMERIFFIKAGDMDDFCNIVLVKSFTYFRDYINNANYKAGFIINISPKTRWEEIEGAQHLEAVEKTLKEPSQFLKIFTKNNKLCVFTNKQPTLNQIIQLKVLQWTIFKDKIETPEPNVLEFLTALLKEDPDRANTAINNILNRPDFKEMQYQALIKIFEYGSRSSIRKIEDRIDATNNMISEYENKLNEYLSMLKTDQELLQILIENPQEDLQPIIKYLSKHPYIKKITVSGQEQIDLYYEAPIIYFDKYILERVIDKRSGLSKQILSIFDKNEYELMTRCQIRFETTTFKVDLLTVGTSGLIGQPHIDRFNCFGNHNDAIRESAREADYLGAIEQISQAVLNLNFADPYVINEMLKTLNENLSTLVTWRHKETGVMCTTKEVLEQYYEEIEAY